MSRDRKVRRAAGKAMRALAGARAEASGAEQSAERSSGQDALAAPEPSEAPNSTTLAKVGPDFPAAQQVLSGGGRPVLTSADIAPPRRKALFELAIRALEHELRATKRVAIMGAKHGAVKGHRVIPDWESRNRAADKVFQILGTYGPRAGSPGGSAQVQVIVESPPWSRASGSSPQVVDVVELPASNV